MACTPAAEKEVYLQVLGGCVLQRAEVGVEQQPVMIALLTNAQLTKVVR